VGLNANSPSLRNLLDAAYRKKLKEVGALLEESASRPDARRPTMGELLQRNPVIKNTAELEDWLYPENDLPEGRSRRAQELTKLFDEAHMPYELTNLFRRNILERRRGAPIKPEVRRLAIIALEAERTDAHFSWMRFAAAHCDCGKDRHDPACKERIRQAARALQRLLARLHIRY
jgi:hypothetical protein